MSKLKKYFFFSFFIFFFCCSYIIVIIYIYSFVKKNNFNEEGSGSTFLVSGNSVDVRRSINVDYIDTLMLNNDIDKCENFYGFCCGGNSLYSKSTNDQVNFILSKVNGTIKSLEDDQQTIKMFYSNYNNNMNKFYKSCINRENSFNHIGVIRICNRKTIYQILNMIDKIKTKHDFVGVYTVLAKCNMNLPIHVTLIDPPTKFTNQIHDDPVIYLYNLINKQRITKEDVLKNFPGINLNGFEEYLEFGEKIKNIKINSQNYQCLSKNVVKNKFFKTILNIEKFIKNSLDYLNFDKSRNYFVCYLYGYLDGIKNLFSQDNDNIDNFKKYLKFSVIETIIGEKNKNKNKNKNKKKNCLDYVLEYFPMSYCIAATNRFNSFNKTILDLNEIKDQIIKFFLNDFEKHPKIYGLDLKKDLKDDVKKILNYIKSVKVSISSCVFTKSDKIFYEYEMKVGVSETRFVENIFKLKKNFDRKNIYKELKSQSPNYNVGKNRITFPFGFILPPKYSLLFSNSSKLGVFGFSLAHELFHAFINALYINSLEEYLFNSLENVINERNEEIICDKFGVLIIVRYMNLQLGSSEFDIEVFFMTLSQFICNEQAHWKYTVLSSGHILSKDRVNEIFHNCILTICNIFNNIYSCIND